MRQLLDISLAQANTLLSASSHECEASKDKSNPDLSILKRILALFLLLDLSPAEMLAEQCSEVFLLTKSSTRGLNRGSSSTKLNPSSFLPLLEASRAISMNETEHLGYCYRS